MCLSPSGGRPAVVQRSVCDKSSPFGMAWQARCERGRARFVRSDQIRPDPDCCFRHHGQIASLKHPPASGRCSGRTDEPYGERPIEWQAQHTRLCANDGTCAGGSPVQQSQSRICTMRTGGSFCFRSCFCLHIPLCKSSSLPCVVVVLVVQSHTPTGDTEDTRTMLA